MHFEAFETFVRDLGGQTAPLIRSAFRSDGLRVETKADDSPVTWADRQVEEIMRNAIERAFPTHGIVGEEFDDVRPTADWVWVLDPIDGTRSFVAGCPLFGSLIGLVHEGEPRFGAIHLPILGDLFLGDGAIATRNGGRVGVRPVDRLEEATLLFTDPVHPEIHQDGEQFARLVRMVRQARTWGDCYGYTLVAGGGADLMADPVLHRWDLMALIPIVRGAGGVITDWQGGDPARGTSALAAASAGLHRQALDILNPD